MEDTRKEIKSLLRLVARSDVGPNTLDYVADEIIQMLHHARRSPGIIGTTFSLQEKEITAAPVRCDSKEALGE